MQHYVMVKLHLIIVENAVKIQGYDVGFAAGLLAGERVRRGLAPLGDPPRPRLNRPRVAVLHYRHPDIPLAAFERGFVAAMGVLDPTSTPANQSARIARVGDDDVGGGGPPVGVAVR